MKNLKLSMTHGSNRPGRFLMTALCGSNLLLSCGIKSFVKSDHQDPSLSFQIVSASHNLNNSASISWTPLAIAKGGYLVINTSDTGCSFVLSTQVVKSNTAPIPSVKNDMDTYECVYARDTSGTSISGAVNNPYKLSHSINSTASTSLKLSTSTSSSSVLPTLHSYLSMLVGDTTLSGTNNSSAGNNGPAYTAGLRYPTAVSSDPSGNLFILDYNQIRMIPKTSGVYFGINMIANNIYIIGGDPMNLNYGSPTPGQPATSQYFSFGPCAGGLASDANSNIYIVQCDNYVYMIPNKSGTYFTQVMNAGYVYVIAGTGGTGFSGNGGLATNAEFDTSATGIAVDGMGNVYVADSYNASSTFHSADAS